MKDRREYCIYHARKLGKQAKRIFAMAILYMIALSGTVNAGEAMVGVREYAEGNSETEEYGKALIDSPLTLAEKVAQLFFITPEALTGVEQVTAAGQATKEAFFEYPVGGIIYFEQNIESRKQLTEMLFNMQSISLERLNVPVFLAVDEEGGAVTRVYGSAIDDIPFVGDMLSVGNTGNTDLAYQAGRQIGTYLADLNFNLDFAPVADIYSNPENTVIGDRSFGYDAKTVSQMVSALVTGMKESGVEPTLKHFPGHGDTSQGSHAGYAASYKTLDEMRECEFLPFKAGAEAGANVIMAGHISLPNVLEDATPASLSYEMITNVLRVELGFNGIVITDALNMGAITYNYSSGDAAVRAIQAGADMLLMPSDFHEAYDTVLCAVQDGRITEERINESVERILRMKKDMR